MFIMKTKSKGKFDYFDEKFMISLLKVVITDKTDYFASLGVDYVEADQKLKTRKKAFKEKVSDFLPN